ncbi:MAG TPA: adenosylcobinamide-GDP ribazoletransferase [Candidatus Limnocylindrales bacterium]|jgi:adenosylcobinamide-GDP ribazoletransferase|nr:adenosylcobinamide-GDP ribazoletransferase [Candidatus Limnocylindrales bacterium]
MNVRRLPPRPGAGAPATVRVGGTIQAAFALLTRLPVRPGDEMASGAAAFPIVGLLVGAVGAVPVLLGGSLEPVVASVLAIAAMTVLTGALHLDGLADTADALLAPDPTTAERARKDPSIGPGGAVALILVLGLEIAALASLVTTGGRPIAAAVLVVAAVVGRTLPVVVVVLAGDRAEGGGFGGWFAARVGTWDVVVAVVLAMLVIAVLAAVTSSPAVVAGGLIGAGAALVIAGAVVSGRRQLDGDGLGAIIELTVAAVIAASAFAAAGLAA